jgi:uncharacterized protein (TIGR02246 family)
MRRRSVFAIIAAVASVAACAAPRFDPNDPKVAATIDSILSVALDGSAHVDADKVLSIAGNDTGLTFITGDLMLSGLDNIRTQFKKTYTGLASQHQTIDQKRVRLIAPDVAIVLATSEGTYTMKSGWTSPPVGIGTTIVFVRQGGTWHAVHAHQSIAF